MTIPSNTLLALVPTGLGVCVFTVVMNAALCEAAEMKVPVTLSGGHQIGKNDFGRPVVLIAAAYFWLRRIF